MWDAEVVGLARACPRARARRSATGTLSVRWGSASYANVDLSCGASTATTSRGNVCFVSKRSALRIDLRSSSSMRGRREPSSPSTSSPPMLTTRPRPACFWGGHRRASPRRGSCRTSARASSPCAPLRQAASHVDLLRTCDSAARGVGALGHPASRSVGEGLLVLAPYHRGSPCSHMRPASSAKAEGCSYTSRTPRWTAHQPAHPRMQTRHCRHAPVHATPRARRAQLGK